MHKAPLRLENPEAIPTALREALQAHTDLLCATTSTENLVRGGPLSRIAEALSEHLRGQRIYAYHCTREPVPGYFAHQGLRATNLKEHQDEFLRTQGHHFTPDEQTYMRTQWAAYFDVHQRCGREGQVWACLTRNLSVSHGTKRFFRVYGGEAIHMPLADDSSALAKLMSVGNPVIVEVALPGDKIRTSYDMAWCALNYHHRRINPRAFPMESEACLFGSVPPADVLAVVPLQQFKA